MHTCIHTLSLSLFLSLSLSLSLYVTSLRAPHKINNAGVPSLSYARTRMKKQNLTLRSKPQAEVSGICIVVVVPEMGFRTGR